MSSPTPPSWGGWSRCLAPWGIPRGRATSPTPLALQGGLVKMSRAPLPSPPLLRNLFCQGGEATSPK